MDDGGALWEFPCNSFGKIIYDFLLRDLSDMRCDRNCEEIIIKQKLIESSKLITKNQSINHSVASKPPKKVSIVLTEKSKI
jgi:hypothetical protein